MSICSFEERSIWKRKRDFAMMEGGMMMGPGGAVVMLLIAVFLLLGIAAFVKYIFFHKK